MPQALSSARCRTSLALVVLCAILLGSLVAGTPVNLDDSHAARTAGINLTTPPVARPAAQQIVSERAIAPFVSIVVLAFAALALASTIRRPEDAELPASVDRTRARTRRGPPSLAQV
jgi:hypothetical protein